MILLISLASIASCLCSPSYPSLLLPNYCFANSCWTFFDASCGVCRPFALCSFSICLCSDSITENLVAAFGFISLPENLQRLVIPSAAAPHWSNSISFARSSRTRCCVALTLRCSDTHSRLYCISTARGLFLPSRGLTGLTSTEEVRC